MYILWTKNTNLLSYNLILIRLDDFDNSSSTASVEISISR